MGEKEAKHGAWKGPAPEEEGIGHRALGTRHWASVGEKDAKHGASSRRYVVSWSSGVVAEIGSRKFSSHQVEVLRSMHVHQSPARSRRIDVPS